MTGFNFDFNYYYYFTTPNIFDYSKVTAILKLLPDFIIMIFSYFHIIINIPLLYFNLNLNFI